MAGERMSGVSEREENLARIIARFLIGPFKYFPRTLFRMLRHPFKFFDAMDARSPDVVYGGIEFFACSFVAEKALWFVSLLPELPLAKYVSDGYHTTTVFVNLFISGVLWHLLLKLRRRRAVPLRSTMAVLLYSAGFTWVLLVPYLVLVKFAGRRISVLLGGDTGSAFLLLMLPFLLFMACVLWRWMSAVHGARMIWVSVTMVVSDLIWNALRDYVVMPWILAPLFGQLLRLYKKIVWLVLS